MKKLLFILVLFLSTLTSFSQTSNDVIVYQDWKPAYNNKCETKYNCIDFYYAITRTKTKVYNQQDGHYYYYYYLVVQSNSTYSNGNWAYTQLTSVSFYLNNIRVHYEPYVLFREMKTICIFWHPTDANASLYFKWQNISLY